MMYSIKVPAGHMDALLADHHVEDTTNRLKVIRRLSFITAD